MHVRGRTARTQLSRRVTMAAGVILAGATMAGCSTSGGLSASSTCGDYLKASAADEQTIVDNLYHKAHPSEPAAGMGAANAVMNVGYECQSRPTTKLGSLGDFQPGPAKPAIATPPTASVAPSGTSSPLAPPPQGQTPGGCAYPKAPKPAAKDVGVPPVDGVDRTTPYVATITLSSGPVTADLATAQAPCTVNSFHYLAGRGYFDGTPCHRLTTQGIFVLQCGDPAGSGSGGPGYQFADENLTGATYPAGTLAMANAGPGTNGSQFFVVYQDTQLPPSYTPFGKVTAGLDVVAAIAKDGTKDGSGDGPPKNEVRIQTLTVAPKN